MGYVYVEGEDLPDAEDLLRPPRPRSLMWTQNIPPSLIRRNALRRKGLEFWKHDILTQLDGLAPE
jgi:hypothetical protein